MTIAGHSDENGKENRPTPKLVPKSAPGLRTREATSVSPSPAKITRLAYYPVNWHSVHAIGHRDHEKSSLNCKFGMGGTAHLRFPVLTEIFMCA